MFWIVAGALALGVAGMMAGALWRGRSMSGPAAAYDLRVYRDQLREVEKDLARGVIAPAEADRLRTEISRRVLDADRAAHAGGGAGAGADTGGTPRAARVGGAVLIAVAVLGGSAWVYSEIGAPGYPDLPLAQRIAAVEAARESRPRQAEAEAQAFGRLPPPPVLEPRHAELIVQLRRAVAERPNDLQGQELLARNEAVAGDFAAAHRAQAAVIALKGPVAGPMDYLALAELMITAAAGYVSPEAETALAEVLRRDPQNGLARYYSGLMFAQTGRPDTAFRLWRPLLEQSTAADPWEPVLRAEIGEIALRAGVDYTPPAPRPAPGTGAGAGIGPGPDAADIEAAASLPPEERMAMVRGMVEGLNARLAAEGGPAEDWARLIRAYGVLGDRDAARAIWTEAAGVFADRTDDLGLLRAAAQAAGVAE